MYKLEDMPTWIESLEDRSYRFKIFMIERGIVAPSDILYFLKETEYLDNVIFFDSPRKISKLVPMEHTHAVLVVDSLTPSFMNSLLSTVEEESERVTVNLIITLAQQLPKALRDRAGLVEVIKAKDLELMTRNAPEYSKYLDLGLSIAQIEKIGLKRIDKQIEERQKAVKLFIDNHEGINTANIIKMFNKYDIKLMLQLISNEYRERSMIKEYIITNEALIDIYQYKITPKLVLMNWLKVMDML